MLSIVKRLTWATPYLPICVISRVVSLDYSHFHLCFGLRKLSKGWLWAFYLALSFVLKKQKQKTTLKHIRQFNYIIACNSNNFRATFKCFIKYNQQEIWGIKNIHTIPTWIDLLMVHRRQTPGFVGSTGVFPTIWWHIKSMPEEVVPSLWPYRKWGVMLLFISIQFSYHSLKNTWSSFNLRPRNKTKSTQIEKNKRLVNK